MTKRKPAQERGYQIFIIAVISIISLTCLFPLIYVVGMSLTSEAELIAKNNFVIIPMKPILTAYTYVLKQELFLNSFLISVARTVTATAISSLSCLVAGYVLSERDLPFRKGIMIFLIITMLIGGGLIPAYLWYGKLGLLNTFWVLVLPAAVNVYGTLVIKTFVENLPGNLLEAAQIDGASQMKRMLYIAFPLTLPALAATALFVAVGQWNSWFDAMIFTVRNEKLYPMALIVRNLLTVGSAGDTTGNPSMSSTPMAVKMASVVISIVPILCVYPFLQKFFIYGVFMGAVKE